ncbi:hypothetical protein FGB62_7g03 [Gracilaria domingensis]|nr:hypothetical protein FGB62_7g03 [Gracilaria domingensis]
MRFPPAPRPPSAPPAAQLRRRRPPPPAAAARRRRPPPPPAAAAAVASVRHARRVRAADLRPRALAVRAPALPATRAAPPADRLCARRLLEVAPRAAAAQRVVRHAAARSHPKRLRARRDRVPPQRRYAVGLATHQSRRAACVQHAHGSRIVSRRYVTHPSTRP